MNKISSKAVLIYINGAQLLYSHDYTFNDRGFVVITSGINDGDILTIEEFDSTNGCYVPPTPTKLGMWSTFDPKVYLDTALINPVYMIQGHDGSKTIAFGDFRDQLLLEFETRIYNNLKVKSSILQFILFATAFPLPLCP